MAENNMIEVGRLTYAKGSYFSGRSGLLTGTITTTNGTGGLFGLRNINNEELIVDSIVMKFATVAAFAAIAPPSFSVYKATSFTTQFAAGQAITPIRKRVGDHTVLPTTEVSCMAATTVALGTGVYTIDINSPIDTLVCDSTLSTVAGFHMGASYWAPKNNIPFSLAADEGLVVLVDTFVAGAGTGRLLVAVDTHKA